VAADAYHLVTGRRVWEEPWPAPDPALLERETYTLVCQVNGKVRDRVQVPADRRFVGLDAYRKVIDSGVDVVILGKLTSPG